MVKMFKKRTARLLCLVLVSCQSLLVAAKANGPGNSKGTFQDPSSVTRPRFRYWLPDASVDADIVDADIKSSAAVGTGGVEFLPFYMYGGVDNGPPPGADWSKANVGTPLFNNLFRTALKAHRDTGTRMDFSIGPNQGQGVPARVDDVGLQWDLVG